MRTPQLPRMARVWTVMAALIASSSSAGPLDTLRASNASVQRTVLDNGMVCLVKEDASAPVVAVCRSGSAPARCTKRNSWGRGCRTTWST